MADPTRPTPFGSPIRGLGAVVQSVALDPDGDTLVAGLADGTTALFDLTDAARPALLASRKQRLGGPRSVAFAPTGRRYAVGGQDNVVTVVDLARMDAVRRDPAARARERAGGGLDRAQWEAFAPGTDYLHAG
jgi:WD40 repeat protein